MQTLVEYAILLVTKEDNATLGTVWVVVAIMFDYQAGHGWYGAWCITFAS